MSQQAHMQQQTVGVLGAPKSPVTLGLLVGRTEKTLEGLRGLASRAGRCADQFWGPVPESVSKSGPMAAEAGVLRQFDTLMDDLQGELDRLAQAIERLENALPV